MAIEIKALEDPPQCASLPEGWHTRNYGKLLIACCLSSHVATGFLDTQERSVFKTPDRRLLFRLVWQRPSHPWNENGHHFTVLRGDVNKHTDDSLGSDLQLEPAVTSDFGSLSEFLENSSQVPGMLNKDLRRNDAADFARAAQEADLLLGPIPAALCSAGFLAWMPQSVEPEYDTLDAAIEYRRLWNSIIVDEVLCAAGRLLLSSLVHGEDSSEVFEWMLESLADLADALGFGSVLNQGFLLAVVMAWGWKKEIADPVLVDAVGGLCDAVVDSMTDATTVAEIAGVEPRTGEALDFAEGLHSKTTLWRDLHQLAVERPDLIAAFMEDVDEVDAYLLHHEWSGSLRTGVRKTAADRNSS